MTTLLILVALIAVVFAFVLARRVETLTTRLVEEWEQRKAAERRADDLQDQLDAAVADLAALRAVRSEAGRKAAVTRRARRGNLTLDVSREVVGVPDTYEASPTLTTDAEGEE